jgi:hypothetical protein
MRRVKRAALIAVAVVAFLAISVGVARYLNNDTIERGEVVDLLREQARGDAPAMLRRLQGCGDAACQATVRANAKRFRRNAAVKIAFYQSQTAHALSSRTKYTRVVWFPAGFDDQTTVQCVLVRRHGNAIAGMTVSLLRITAAFKDRESSCPPS